MWTAPPLPRTLEAALRDLDEASPRVRVSAVLDLARHVDDEEGRGRAEAGLVRMLRDPSAEVRAAAARSLGEAGVRGAVGDLLLAVEDHDPLVRQLALEALGELGGELARERVRRALDDERPELRFQAVMAFAKLAPGEADEALGRAAGDRDGGVRYIALRVAEERLEHGSRAAPRSLEAARRCLADERPENRVAAALLLAKAGDQAGASVLMDVVEDRLRTAEVEDEAAAVEAAGALGLTKAMPALEKRAYGVARLTRERCSFHARIALARLGHLKARGEIVRELGGLLRTTRTKAVMAAGRAGLREALSTIEAMRGRPDLADEDAVSEALAALARAR